MKHAFALFVSLAALIACSSQAPPGGGPGPAGADEKSAAVVAVPTAAAAPSHGEAPSPGSGSAGADGFVVETSVETEGSGRLLVAEVTPSPGFHINLEFPWALTVAADAPVLAGKRFTRDEAKQMTKEQAAFALSVPAEGSGTVNASLRMSVCNDRECRTPTTKLAWNLTP
jgi:hypothetical protein